ncbi:DNA-binding HTH domain-containing protein, TetR-type, partial [Klenkia terrae]
VRDRALDAARALTVQKGWSRVRMGDVAALTGVSRPTLYKQFGDKQGLGEALIMEETERFLVGISGTLEAHPQDAAGGITAAIEYVLAEADASPLLCAILTSARDADNELLPMLTTRSAPVLDAATRTLISWFTEHFPQLDPQDLADGVDAVVRLAVSHLVLPVDDRTTTARRLTRIALRTLQLGTV